MYLLYLSTDAHAGNVRLARHLVFKLRRSAFGNGAVAVGLENGHAGFLRFKFRSRTGNGSLDRKELISD